MPTRGLTRWRRDPAGRMRRQSDAGFPNNRDKVWQPDSRNVSVSETDSRCKLITSIDRCQKDILSAVPHRSRSRRVEFVHGLGGDAFITWGRDVGDDTFWPQWIADDLKQVDVYSLDYEASPSAWLGTTMPLFDRAKQVLAWLEEVAHRPLVFVCHSMGGLLAKELIRHGNAERIFNL